MLYRLEIALKKDFVDGDALSIKKKLNQYFSYDIENLYIHKVFKILSEKELSDSELNKIKMEFADPVLEISSYEGLLEEEFDTAIIIGFKPGVTDSVGKSARVAISDITGIAQKYIKVFTEKIYYFKASSLKEGDFRKIGFDFLANELIENIRIVSKSQMLSNGIDMYIPEVRINHKPTVIEIDLEISDNELMKLSKERVLSLTLEEMKAIQKYYRNEFEIEKRKEVGLSNKATDVELEALAQTWSEHCKHKIFNAHIDYYEKGNKEEISSLFKDFIKRSTKEISKRVDFLVSVFDDNAGVIKFNDDLNIVYKVETHNSPSALDPYGGAMTGIVGVNRDPAGTGLGAELLINTWGYCFGDINYQDELPKGILHPVRIREGVHKGVIDGGNQSGIPYGRGWELFDNKYIGKPLVFCGTVGYLPRSINNIDTSIKVVKPGYKIVMVGGRIGKDGIHGATFSSEELHEESPTQAVQIGDPITQKMMFDFLKEARDRLLYTAITDNGAGGLSSSVGEMAEFTNGCRMDLANAPLKYKGLDPWEILISEAQERMTLAVPPENIDELKKLAEKRNVEMSVLGEFTDSGYFHILYDNKTVAFLNMDFLHNGVPQMKLVARWEEKHFVSPELPEVKDFAKIAREFLSRLNLSAKDDIYRHYDHEVKGNSVIKPFIGKNRNVPSEATVFSIFPGAKEGIVLSEGINPYLSYIDTYYMTGWIIDNAIRKVLSIGGKISNLSGLDNFCWPDPVKSEKTPDGEYKLAQLVRANKALYDFTTAFDIPLISGKDSMKNDAIMYGEKISIPPTLLFSLIGRIEEFEKIHTLQPIRSDELVYLIGTPYNSLAGSEFYRYLDEEKHGCVVPALNVDYLKDLYNVMEKLNSENILKSCAVPGIGGIFYSLFKMSIASGYGMDLNLNNVLEKYKLGFFEFIFNESPGIFIVTIDKNSKEKFEYICKDYCLLGTMASEYKFFINLKDSKIGLDINELYKNWRGEL